QQKDINMEKDRTINLKEYTISNSNKPTIGMIGAGNYTNQTLLPAMQGLDIVRHTIVSTGGTSGVNVGQKFNFLRASTELEHVLNDDEINTLIITTRHNSHASLVKQGLNNKKHVFVEKPLCLTRNELEEIKGI